ncbi:unnamed protein product, partial [Ectocarpus fasciculatus]
KKRAFPVYSVGERSSCGCQHRNTFKATIDFSLFNIPYTFTILSWSRRGLAKYLNLFHEFVQRDVAQYGLRVEDSTAMTVSQKLNCVEHGCRDFVTCLGQIGTVHQRSMLEYAVWYRELHVNPATYEQFITLMTCHCIVHNDFMAPNVLWTVVEFH